MWQKTSVAMVAMFVGAMLLYAPLRAQVQQRDRNAPYSPALPVPPTTQPQPYQPYHPQTDTRPMPLPRPIAPPVPQPIYQPPVTAPAAPPNLVPSFLQAGRTYAFQPVVGDPFVARIIAIDATGWIQVQRQPAGSDVGPVAEYYNLQCIVAIKAQQ